MAQSVAGDLWHELEGDRCAEAVVMAADGLKADAEQRRGRYFAAASLYEQRPVSDETMGFNGWYEKCLYNVSRSAVDTAQAEIAARQRPKPMFLTTGADWRTKRKAKKLDRFVEAQLHQGQGARYADAWELAEDAFRDAEIAVGGCVKVTVDAPGERIRLERVPVYELRIDPVEASNGDPQNWFHVYEMSESQALAQFAIGKGLKAEEIRGKIRSASRASMSDYKATAGRRVSRSIQVYEAWFLPPSADEPGKHVFACDQGMLWEGEWTWPFPPLALIAWNREMFGIWGTGLVEAGANQHAKIQEMTERMHERIALCSHRRTYYESGSEVDLESMKRNDVETFIPVHDIAKVPRSEEVPPIGPADLQLLDREIEKYYDFSGVSQMNASARKEPGVDAAIAMQTLNDIKSVRFMSKARAYELLFVRIGELIVRAARDLAEEMGGNFTTKWPGKKFLQEIAWKDVDLGDEMYNVRVAPVSAMSRDPAQRLQLVEQLSNLGYLPREKYLELMQLPDLDAWLEAENSENEWTEHLLDRYLDAEDEKDLKKLGGFQPADPNMLNPKAALATATQHYFAAMTEGMPAFNAQLMRDFMAGLKKLVIPAAPAPVQAMAAGAALPAPATMQTGPVPPPMGAPPPGMPPPMGGPPGAPMGMAA